MPDAKSRSWTKTLLACFLTAAAVSLAIAIFTGESESDSRPDTQPLRFAEYGGVVDWWSPSPTEVKTASLSTESGSNIARSDYAGPDACAKCHSREYDMWSEHPHRWMNARATEETVRADFESLASLTYLKGKATFYREDDGYRMKLERDGVRRIYTVTQTIGSRFFQYCVGHQLEGPEPSEHACYTVDHVLPFGYWLDRKEWVPTVHVHWAELHGEAVDEEDLPSEQRHDPFALPHERFSYTMYYQCNQCHTTMPFGDLMVRNPALIGRHSPVAVHFSVPDYLAANHKEIDQLAGKKTSELSDQEISDILSLAQKWDAREEAVTLGISCESCHLGAKEHAIGAAKRPHFFPRSPDLYPYTPNNETGKQDYGRSHANVNWACGRCHSGNRRLLAGGMSTWNSTEYTDAMRGSCYSELTCIDCHNPHQATGPKWTVPANQSDSVCLRCHDQFESPLARQAHTHHSPDTMGSHCMDCHMPRLNEGLQDVVRTHMIFSPTQPQMIEANQPNACNMCHVDKPIDWTLGRLSEWYGREYDTAKIAASDGLPNAAAGISWLHSSDQSVRLIALDALARRQSHWALPHMLKALDDPFIINRQFARISIEELLDVQLSDHGYHFYMTAEERIEPLGKLRQLLLPENSADGTSPMP
ncbi:MAG: cytochrome c3 family protein [Pirellulaceae bacterium]